MPGNDDYVKRTYGDNTALGGAKVNLDRVDPRRVDDFSPKWKKREEERRKQNQPSGQGNSKS
ncbi:hypothetical protein [Wolbachia endosymbiont of Cantharis cryptica]|uniref:hypothetical protein n=1 Tax=Wolbachia endosymbiont of Cantharis cryptica TaxID=3066132 RepID=UPI00376F18ED